MEKKKRENLPTKAQIDEFEMANGLLNSLGSDFTEFAKKKPDDPINKLKIKMVNRVLEKVNNILSAEPSIEFLELLEEDQIPSNSDTVIIIGQYQAACRNFREKYYGYDGGVHKWFTRD